MRHRKIMATFITVVMCASLSSLDGSPPAAAVDIHGDDARDSYSGVGALILPPGTDQQARREAAECTDCRWVVSSPCDTPYGVAFLQCRSHVLECPPGTVEKRAWLQAGSAPWADRGLLCVSTDGPMTRARLGEVVHGEFLQRLPALTPRHLPESGVVTQLPVLFHPGQSVAPVEVDVVVAGQRVHLRATARWEWAFGDGESLIELPDGALTRGMPVAHVYRHGGIQEVRVRATWNAAYTVSGLGPFDIPEPVQQEAVVMMRVGQAHATLTRPVHAPRSP